MSKRMSLEEYEKQIEWFTKEEAARRIKKDLLAMRSEQIKTFQAVADNTWPRFIAGTGDTNTLGEHDPVLRKEIWGKKLW